MKRIQYNIQTMVFFTGILLLTIACKKNESTGLIYAPKIELYIECSFTSAGKPLYLDTLLYKNEVGNPYLVNRLQFYHSSVTLYRNKEAFSLPPNFQFIDLRENQTHHFKIEAVKGSFDSIGFLIGLPPTLNQSEALPAHPMHINMAWPVVLGGGYHFLKFEGYYTDSNAQRKGFTIHLGENAYLIQHNKLPSQFELSETQVDTLKLNMDVNEFFTNPYNYNFNKDGNYTMAVPQLMKRISENGKDVFTINPH